MFKKTVTFTDFNGEKVTDDFYFHMTEADLARMEMSKMGLEEYIQRIVKANDGAKIVELFEGLIRNSYGVKSTDGRNFSKNPQFLEDFMASQAYSEIFMELVTDASAGAAFVNGIMPETAKARIRAKEALSGERPTLVAVDEAVQDSPLAAEAFGISENLQEHLDVKPSKNQPKHILVAKMKIKQGQAVKIDAALLDALTEAELSKAIENGSELV